MKKCTGCNAEIDDTSKYCPCCGMECVETENTSARNESGWQPENFKADMQSGKKRRMIWHKIVLFFLLMQGLINILLGIHILNSYADLLAPDRLAIVKAIFVAIGVVYVAFGVFCLIVFSRLGKRMKNGPQSLKILYRVCITCSIVLLVLLSLTSTGIRRFGARIILGLLFNVVMLIVSKRYYGKREDMFAN